MDALGCFNNSFINCSTSCGVFAIVIFCAILFAIVIKSLSSIACLSVLATLFICSNVFLIVTNIRLDQKLDELTKGLDEYCKNIGYDID